MEQRRRAFLPEVQALRAVAVLLVVLYHFWPNRLQGGYVGVDVFFVISGFLITSHLHREVAASGSVSLTRFYARRARRLLPAALLVLLATGVASFALLPETRWAANAGDILASTFYVQNWQLAARAVDYSASSAAASAVQHFWSLSVEEQFYLAWPPLILLLLAVSRRLRSIRRDSLLLGGIGGVTALSLGWSIYATAADPAAAYFVTPTRIWELGAGALLALARVRRDEQPRGHPRPGRGPGLALRWAGLAAIGGSAVLLSGASAFPGYLALVPVLGTVAVIAAGDTGPLDPLSRVIVLPPVQFLGDVSYSLYLWHWPFLVMAPFALGHPLPAVQKLELLAVCITVAWLTKLWVEEPTQRSRVFARPVATAAFTVAAMLVVSAVSALQSHEVGQQEAAARARLAVSQEGPCFGAAARVGHGCSDPFGLAASSTLAPEDRPWFPDPACTVTLVPVRIATCQFSSKPPARTVALVGDSHAEHWRAPLHRIAKELNWKIVEVLRGGCPVTSARVVAFDGRATDTQGCQDWGRQVSRVLADDRPDYVFTSSWAAAMTFEGGRDAGVRGFLSTWTTWADSGAQVFVLRDVPGTGHVDIPECLMTHPGRPTDCARPRSQALAPDSLSEAARQARNDRIRSIDLSDLFCDRATCYAAIGGAIVYWDHDHMSAQFSRSLAPYLLDRIVAAAGGRP